MGKMCVLCIDVQVDSTLDSDSFGDEKRLSARDPEHSIEY